MEPRQGLEPSEADQERPATLEQIDALILTSKNPRFVEQCKSFRNAYQSGDEIVEYCTSAASWEALMGSHGFLLRRFGIVVDSLTIRMN